MKDSKILTIIVIVVLIFNSVLLMRSMDLVSLPGEVTKFELTRAGTEAMLAYLENYAADLGVENYPAVKESLSLLQYKIETAGNEEELAQIIITESRTVQETILIEHETQRNKLILRIISTDPNLANAEENESIVVWGDLESGIQVSDNAGILASATIIKLQTSDELPPVFSEVAVNIVNGVPRIIPHRRVYDRLESLEKEVITLQKRLISVETLAGYRQMVGEGIELRLYDAEGGYQQDDIIHDADVRDVLNELFSSGAKGIAVGEQRIIARSSIRCVGPVLLVDYEPVAVNPVVIRAVGDPEKLASGVDLIKNTLENVRGVRIEVSVEDKIVLPAYTSSRN